MFLGLDRFRSVLTSRVVAAVAALTIALTPRMSSSYSTGDLKDPPESFSIHPLLVEPLREAYHQVFPQGKVDFSTSDVQSGTIKEDSAPTYTRAFHHFLQWQTGEGFKGQFSPSDEWAQDCNAQASALQGNHCWDKIKEEATRPLQPFLGEDFGFLYHLNADLTVPAHVWDDAHPPGEQVVGGLAHTLGLYSDPYETWTDANKDIIMSQVHPNLNALPDITKFPSLGALMKDLAYFTGSNFYSADALDGRNPNNCEWDSTHTYCYRDIKDTIGRVIKSNVPILHSGFFTDYPDSTCFEEYWPILSAKTVEYGIAMIKLLFDDTSCTPNCYDRQCGDDGCGGSCGTCDSGLFCSTSGLCLEDCIGDCSSKVCGDNGCGGSCGSCSSGYNCNDGQCTKECGANSCGGSCGSCPSGVACVSGECENCVSECNVPEKSCSGNLVIGCEFISSTCERWGSPQECAPDYVCKEGTCVYDPDCVPNCTNKMCGPDWCGGSCGDCSNGYQCDSGVCEEKMCAFDYFECQGDVIVEMSVCNQVLSTKDCSEIYGMDGNTKHCYHWGSGDYDITCYSLICSLSEPNKVYWSYDGSVKGNQAQDCGVYKCIEGECSNCKTQDHPSCKNNSVYWMDSCGNLEEMIQNCGSSSCSGGECVCTPNCLNKECGDDGCGESCGSCPSGSHCGSYYETPNHCVGDCSCLGKQCGDDGCGGNCGSCGSGYTCDNGECVSSACSKDSDCNVGYLCKNTTGNCVKAGGSLCTSGSCTNLGVSVCDNGGLSDDSFGLEIVGSFYGETDTGGCKNWNISTNAGYDYQMKLYGVGVPDGIGTYVINLTNATFFSGPDMLSNVSASGEGLTGGQSYTWIIKTK